MHETGSASKRKHTPIDGHLGDQAEIHGRVGGEDSSDARPRKREKASDISAEDALVPLPHISRYLPLTFGGSHWHAEKSLQTIVILGDSYSKSKEGTWVEHLERRLQKKNRSPKIHNLALPGATAQDDLPSQLSRCLRLFPKKDSTDGPSKLDPHETTCFVFIGINDCGSNDSVELEDIVETVFDVVHDLYVKAGARNFVLVDVPPIDRSPQAVSAGISDEVEERVKTWNELLRAQTTEFGRSTKEATVFLLSSHQVFSEVLNDPAEFDFGEEDPTTEGGAIWEDELHLTADVHDILAERLLASVSASHL